MGWQLPIRKHSPPGLCPFVSNTAGMGGGSLFPLVIAETCHQGQIHAKRVRQGRRVVAPRPLAVLFV